MEEKSSKMLFVMLIAAVYNAVAENVVGNENLKNSTSKPVIFHLSSNLRRSIEIAESTTSAMFAYNIALASSTEQSKEPSLNYSILAKSSMLILTGSKDKMISNNAMKIETKTFSVAASTYGVKSVTLINNHDRHSSPVDNIFTKTSAFLLSSNNVLEQSDEASSETLGEELGASVELTGSKHEDTSNSAMIMETNTISGEKISFDRVKPTITTSSNGELGDIEYQRFMNLESEVSISLQKLIQPSNSPMTRKMTVSKSSSKLFTSSVLTHRASNTLGLDSIIQPTSINVAPVEGKQDKSTNYRDTDSDLLLVKSEHVSKSTFEKLLLNTSYTVSAGTKQNSVKSSSAVVKGSTYLKTIDKSSMPSNDEETYSLTEGDLLPMYQKTPSTTKLMSSSSMTSLGNFEVTQNAVKSSSVVLKESTSLKTMDKSSMSSIYEESYNLEKDDLPPMYQKTSSTTKLTSSPQMTSLGNFETTQNAVKSSSVVLKESTSLKTMDKSSMSSIYEESYNLKKDDLSPMYQKTPSTPKLMSSSSMTSLGNFEVTQNAVKSSSVVLKESTSLKTMDKSSMSSIYEESYNLKKDDLPPMYQKTPSTTKLTSSPQMTSLGKFATTQNSVKSSSVFLKESTPLKTMDKSSMSSIYEKGYSLTKDDLLPMYQKTPSTTKLMSSSQMTSLENFPTTQSSVKSSSVVLKESTSLKTMDKSSMSSIYKESYSLTKDDLLPMYQKTPTTTKLMSSIQTSSLENFVTTQNAVKSSSVVLKESTSLKTMDKSSMSSIYEESYSLTKDDLLPMYQKTPSTTKLMSSIQMSSLKNFVTTQKAVKSSSVVLKESTPLKTMDKSSMSSIYEESYSLTKDDLLPIHQKSPLTSLLAKTMSSPSMSSITKPKSPSALASTMKAMSPPSMILTTKLVVADYHLTTFIYQTIRNVSTVRKSSLLPTVISYNPKGTLSPEIDKTETYFSSYTIQTNTSTNPTEKKETSTTIFDLKKHDVFKSTSKLWKTPALVTSKISKQNNTIRYSTVSSIPLTASIIEIFQKTFQISLLITSEPFKIEYTVTSSPEFKKKSKEIEENFDKVFRDTTYYSSSEVISFFEGSLGCIANVYAISNDVKVKDIDQTLRNKIDEDGFGEMNVSSIEVKVFEVVTAKQDEEKRHSGWSTLAIVFVSVLGGICVLLVLCVIILCIQKRQYTHFIEESNGLQEHSPSIQLKRHGSILAEDEERVPMKTSESTEF